MGTSGRSAAGFRPSPSPHLHFPGFLRCTDLDPPCVQSVDLSSAAFLWSKVPPKFPLGQELVESLVFPLVALCRCQTTGSHRPPAFHGGAPPPQRCSLLSACNSIIRVTPLGQRHRVSKCTLQGPRNPESLGAGAGESSGVTAGPGVQAPLLLSSDFTLTKMKKLELLNWEILKYLCFILSKIYTMNLDSFCSEARLKQTRNKHPDTFRQLVALGSR